MKRATLTVAKNKIVLNSGGKNKNKKTYGAACLDRF